MTSRTARETTRKMIELFPGVRIKDLTDLVDANAGKKVGRGTVEGLIMSLGPMICEDDDGGLWIYSEEMANEFQDRLQNQRSGIKFQPRLPGV